MKSNSWIQTWYFEAIYLNSYIYGFLYEFRISGDSASRCLSRQTSGLTSGCGGREQCLWRGVCVTVCVCGCSSRGLAGRACCRRWFYWSWCWSQEYPAQLLSLFYVADFSELCRTKPGMERSGQTLKAFCLVGWLSWSSTRESPNERLRNIVRWNYWIQYFEFRTSNCPWFSVMILYHKS